MTVWIGGGLAWTGRGLWGPTPSWDDRWLLERESQISSGMQSVRGCLVFHRWFSIHAHTHAGSPGWTQRVYKQNTWNWERKGVGSVGDYLEGRQWERRETHGRCVWNSQIIKQDMKEEINSKACHSSLLKHVSSFHNSLGAGTVPHTPSDWPELQSLPLLCHGRCQDTMLPSDGIRSFTQQDARLWLGCWEEGNK